MQAVLGFFERMPQSVLSRALTTALTIFFGIVIIRVILLTMRKTLLKRATEHNRLLVQNIVVYAGSLIVFVTVLGDLGFNLTTLLGAAGIVGIAIGFASQTSVSNIISGLFLLSEKPFAVGDVIRVGDKSGIILSVDLMSIKIRTFDNLFIRLPNQMVLNNEVTNITRFPIRRLDLNISVAYKEDIGRVRALLLEIVLGNPFALNEPEPLVLLQNFGASGIEILVGVWFLKTDFVALKNSLIQGIKERFDAEGIEFPFPHRTLYPAGDGSVFPIRIVNDPLK